jgi:hypothetical protein
VPAIALLAALVPGAVSAQTPAAPTFTFAGYLQTQYNRLSVEDSPHDRVIFRRAIVGVEAELSERWMGELQADIAPVSLGERIEVRDAYLRYTGLTARGVTFTLGNQKTPFARSVLTSSARRGLVERPVTGERAYGSPGRAISLRVDGRDTGHLLLWSGAVASVHHAPTSDQIRLDGLATSRVDWNEGVMVSGRAEWHPRGFVALEQGAFDVKNTVMTIAAGAYHWVNDGDNNLFTEDGHSTSLVAADLDRATGLELSGGMRAPRLSLDAELHRITGRTIDPEFTGGLYRAGRTRLIKSSIEAGYMLVPPHLELLGGVETLDVEAYESVTWRPVAGVNWYVYRHKLKFQFMQRETLNDLGVRGQRGHATYLQAQIAF